MQSMDLVGYTSGKIFSIVDQLKPNELFYVRVKSLINMPEEVSKLILLATSVSSHVIVSIPGEEFSLKTQTDILFSHGVKGFSLRYAHNVHKWLKHQGMGQFNAGDRDIIDSYKEYLRMVPEGKELAVEFQVGDDIRVLAPTITGLYELGSRWVLLNVEGEPTHERCVQMRDVFEYVKIRGCTRMNIYFPFWGPYYREWDIKTQNTFSGLEFVHIDISNRCTHSCVFCGLYGPDAVEDTKKRSGGELPEALKKHMKMEIDSEKCFNIIQSLPWSVKQIQFGGFGDPLMHENAVNFIAAARKRGFQVEMLSNMEYLEDSDIENLHKLGGRNKLDLHFIANISGGTAENYIKTRPKQTEKHFNKIVHNLTLFSKLRKENHNNGVNFMLMCVVNKLNCHHLLEVAELAEKIGAHRIWFKPMEIHAEIQRQIVPTKDLMSGMAKSLAQAVEYAEKKNIEVFQKDYCEQIISKYSSETFNV